MSTHGARRQRTGGSSRAVAISALFFTVLAALAILDQFPVALLAAYGVLSGLTFAMYRADKSAAQQGRWRTPESTLHAVSVMGGWPGALVARRVFRHKTIKQPFRAIFWLTVVVNCVAVGLLVREAPLPLP